MNELEMPTSNYALLRIQGKERNVHFHDIGVGPAVFMLHGSGPGASGWGNFHRNVDAFVRAGCRVILPDSLGWGKSDSIVIGEGWRSDINVETVIALMDFLGLPKAHVIGNSMGGGTTLGMAIAHPARIGKMVLMGSGGVGSSIFQPTPLEGIKQVGLVYRNPSLENLKKMMELFVYDTSKLNEEFIAQRFDSMLQNRAHLTNFVESQKAPNKGFYPDMSQRLGDIQAPTLITWGRDDRFVPLDSALKLLWGIRDADLYVFSQCGHWAQWEHADKFNRLCLDFLQP